MPTDMSTTEKERRFAKRRVEWQEDALRKCVWMSCLNCERFNKGKTVCEKYHATPPLHVIVHGCREWEQEIPF